MKEEIWNELYLYLIRIEIGVFKNFKECARSPCNGNHFSSIVYEPMLSLYAIPKPGIRPRGPRTPLVRSYLSGFSHAPRELVSRSQTLYYPLPDKKYRQNRAPPSIPSKLARWREAV